VPEARAEQAPGAARSRARGPGSRGRRRAARGASRCGGSGVARSGRGRRRCAGRARRGPCGESWRVSCGRAQAHGRWASGSAQAPAGSSASERKYYVSGQLGSIQQARVCTRQQAIFPPRQPSPTNFFVIHRIPSSSSFYRHQSYSPQEFTFRVFFFITKAIPRFALIH
jgi:hypothetical protein